MVSTRLTLIVTTIRRPKAVRRFLKSVRRFCPTMPIILSEQANEHQLIEFCANQSIEHLPLQFDCGISHARNLMVDRVKTQYFILTDDDFLFGDAPDFDFCIRFLDATPEFLCVLGHLDDYKKSTDGYVHEKRDRTKNICLDDTGGGVVFIPLRLIRPIDFLFEGEKLACCDFGPNWGVFRKSFFVKEDFWWDDQFKIGGEHLDFYLRLKLHRPRTRVAYWSKLRCDHIPVVEDGYLELRHRQNWREPFRAKWRIRYRYDLGNLRFYDDWANPVTVSSPAVVQLERQLHQTLEANRKLRERIAVLESGALSEAREQDTAT